MLASYLRAPAHPAPGLTPWLRSIEGRSGTRCNRYQLLHARNWRGDGDLTPQKIETLVAAVGEEISDEAELVLGTYPDVED